LFYGLLCAKLGQQRAIHPSPKADLAEVGHWCRFKLLSVPQIQRAGVIFIVVAAKALIGKNRIKSDCPIGHFHDIREARASDSAGASPPDSVIISRARPVSMS
jgi:hypothetical protein